MNCGFCQEMVLQIATTKTTTQVKYKISAKALKIRYSDNFATSTFWRSTFFDWTYDTKKLGDNGSLKYYVISEDSFRFKIHKSLILRY